MNLLTLSGWIASREWNWTKLLFSLQDNFLQTKKSAVNDDTDILSSCTFSSSCSATDTHMHELFNHLFMLLYYATLDVNEYSKSEQRAENAVESCNMMSLKFINASETE
jgi:hypothetical protein